MRKIVLPGEKIAERPLHLDTTYVEGGHTYTNVMGMIDEEGRYTPLEAVYTPKPDDTVVGIVTDSRSWGYSVDINLPYTGGIPAKFTRLKFYLGDIIVARVGFLNSSGDIDLRDVKKLSRGKLFKVPPSKVPRIIGRQSSMITMIRENTGTHVAVGNNGYIWVSEQGNIPLVIKVIDEIVKNAHKQGLTDKISKFLSENVPAGTVKLKAESSTEGNSGSSDEFCEEELQR